MNAPSTTSDHRITVWDDQTRLRGLARLYRNILCLGRQLALCILTRFIGFLGSISTPGMRPVCVLQTWALRLMGAQCASSEIWIGPNVRFDYPEHIVFGRRITIAGDAIITAFDTVVLGDDFLGAPGLFINTGLHDLATLVPASAPIIIGDRVWCGVRVTLCAGVTVGDDAIVGAGSVVLHDLPAAFISVGTPCKPKRDISGLRGDRSKLWSNFNRS